MPARHASQRGRAGISCLVLADLASTGKGLALRAVFVALGSLALWLTAASAQNSPETPPLIDRLTPDVMHGIFPAATRIEAVKDNGPTAAAAYAGTELVGYVFSTLDVLRAPG